MNAWEKQEEKEIALVFKRPERDFIKDFPTYPYFPKPMNKINFDLNFDPNC